jgi:ABC-type multidrug transport system fused ATPase/permease subunit
MKLLLKIIIAALIIFIIYQSRWILSFKYEPEYYENFFYESQYSYPSSARGISDGTLYKFVGYRLTQGENPFNINWEIPPFGKVLYGYSSRFLGSPFWFSLACFFTALVVFFLILSKNFKNYLIPFIGVVFLILIPHFSNQISDTMLDLPLTLAYLAHMFFFFNYIDKKKIMNLVVAGSLLGIASAIKPPIYVPFILLFELLIVYLNEKKLRRVLMLPIFVFAGYVLGYFIYFVRHPNPIPWLRLHEKIYDFYSGSKLGVNYTAAIKELFNFGTWGFVYVAGLISYCVSWTRYFKNKKDLKLLTAILFSTVFLVVNSFIPFYPRYLLPLSFTFIYLILFMFKDKLIIPLFICVLSFPFFYKAFIPSDPGGDVGATARFIETRADRELYRAINPSKRKEISENDFINTLESFNNTLGTRKIQVTIGEGNKLNNKYYYDLNVKYATRFGVVENNIPFEYENVQNQWKLNWNWDYLYKDFLPGLNVEFTKKPLQPSEIYEVYIIPRLMFDWTKNLDNLSRLTGVSSLVINQKLTSVVPNGFEKFVGYLSKDVSEVERDEIMKDNGVVRIKKVYLDPKTESESNSLILTKTYSQ